MRPNPQFPVDLVTFTEEICDGKLHFLGSVSAYHDPVHGVTVSAEANIGLLEHPRCSLRFVIIVNGWKPLEKNQESRFNKAKEIILLLLEMRVTKKIFTRAAAKKFFYQFNSIFLNKVYT